MASRRVPRLVVLIGFGLMLGACTKCDIPTWQRSSLETAPLACHGTPQPQ